MDTIEKARQARKAAGEAPVMLKLAKGLGTVFVAGIGVMLSATLCSLAYPEPAGVGAIGGGIAGALVFGLLGCCATGLWSDLFSFDINAKPSFIPHSVYSAVGVHGDFKLILTVKSVDDFVQVNNRFLGSRPQLFVEVECGDNPIKQTCVNSSGHFEEQFKLDVKASDSSLVLYVKDQGLFGANVIGYVSLDIQKEIVDQNEPDHEILGGSGYTLVTAIDTIKKAKIHLSFEMPDIDGQSPADKKQKVMQAQTEWKKKGYGAVDFLPAFAFNTSTTMNFDAASKDNEQKV